MTDNTTLRTRLFTVLMETIREYGEGLTVVEAAGVLEEVKMEMLVAGLTMDAP
jgi:putative heme iron utilization protein